jgi:UDP-glucose 4-epimerase
MKKKHDFTILVSGGAGFIGSHLVDELLKRNFRVRVIDSLINGRKENLESHFGAQNFTFLKGDILNKKDCERAVSGIDLIYHLACLGVRHSIKNPWENQRVNAEGTLNLLLAAKNFSNARFIYISSSEVYGATNTFPITENALPCPLTIYGASKLAGEKYTLAFHHCYGMNATVVRLFNNYGPRAHWENDTGELIPRTIVFALCGKNPVVFGKGTNTRDFLYVKDTAYALAELIKLHVLKGKMVNIGSDREIKILNVVKLIIKLIDRKGLKIDFQPKRPADVPRLWAEAKIFSELSGFKPRYSFAKGLLETIAYYKKLKESRNLLSEIKIKNWE